MSIILRLVHTHNNLMNEYVLHDENICAKHHMKPYNVPT